MSKLQAERLKAAAETQGQARAACLLPPLPDEFRQPMGRVYPKTTETKRSTQLRWEFVAEFEDRKNARQAQFYDDVRDRLGRPDR